MNSLTTALWKCTVLFRLHFATYSDRMKCLETKANLNASYSLLPSESVYHKHGVQDQFVTLCLESHRWSSQFTPGKGNISHPLFLMSGLPTDNVWRTCHWVPQGWVKGKQEVCWDLSVYLQRKAPLRNHYHSRSLFPNQTSVSTGTQSEEIRRSCWELSSSRVIAVYNLLLLVLIPFMLLPGNKQILTYVTRK